MLAEVALIKLTKPSMEPDIGSLLERVSQLEEALEDLEAGRRALPPAASVPKQEEASSTPQPPRTSDSESPVRQVALPKAQLEDLQLVRNEWARLVREMGGGARAYLRDTVVEPGGDGCLTIVFLDPMNYDMGKRPTVIGELERQVEARYGRSIYFKTRLAGRGERLDTIYVTEEELEEKIHMDITYED